VLFSVYTLFIPYPYLPQGGCLMGWALNNLSADARERIARSLFVANDGDSRVDGDTWINGLCPLHEDRQQSFGYNVTKDYFHCLAACTKDSDLVDLWCLVNGYGVQSREGFNAFKRKFAADAGLGEPNRRTPGQRKPKPENTPETERKAIPEDVYTAFGPIPDTMFADLRQRRGWSRETVEILGIRLLTHYRKATSPYKLFPVQERNRVIIPIRDDSGTLWNIRTYYPFGVPDDAPRNKNGEAPAKIMSWAKGHGSARIFPPLGTLRPDAPVILAEGEADCICALSHGLNSITQTSKTTYWPDDAAKALSGRAVYIAYDADGAGQEYAQKAAKALHKAGCSVFIIEWPDYMGRLDNGKWPADHGQDLTDFFVRHSKTVTDFMVLMDKAHPYPQPPARNTASDGGDGQDYNQFFRFSSSGRWSFGERLLADYLVETQTMLFHDKSGQLYRWTGTHYELWTEEKLRKAAIHALGDEATASRVNASCSIATALVATPQDRDLNDMPEWVCLNNGMLNLYTLEFKEHSPDFLASIKLNVNWHCEGETVTPKALDELLARIMPKRWRAFCEETMQTTEVIMQLQEFFGYCLTRETKFGKALLLLGPGSDGKSKVLSVLRALVGPKNCSAVSMSGLDDQFQRAALFGKILNVATEITTDAVQSEFFKSVVTGDPIQASFKHKDSFEFIPYCKLAYASNKMPRVFDNSDGFFRRLLPVQFKRQFLENDPDQDPDLEGKLMQELDGIFLWAIIGLHRLMENQRFTVAEETIAFIMKYRRYNNPVMAFVQDKCIIAGEAEETAIKELYKAYKEYCSEGGFRPANRENFYEELVSAARKLNEYANISRHRPRLKSKAQGTDRPDLVRGIILKYEAS
jgi:putative DNA primase/helicase